MTISIRARRWLIVAAGVSTATSGPIVPVRAAPPPAPAATPVSVQAGATSTIDGVLQQQHDENGEISGQLALPPRTWIRHVYIYSSTGHIVATIGNTRDGTFSTWVPPSAVGYAVCFDARPKLVATCLPNVAWNYEYQAPPPAGARYVPVHAGQQKDVGVVSLHRGGRITGRVRNQAGEPARTLVVARSLGHTEHIGYALSGVDGKYNLHRLPPSKMGWRVCFKHASYDEANLRRTCYRSVVYSEPGHPTRHIDATVKRGGVIAGTVRSAGDNKPLDAIGIAVFNRRGREVSSGEADRSGHYTVNSLAAGKYRVCAAPYRKSNHLGRCYRGSRWADGQKPSGDTIVVRAKHTTHGVNLRLGHGATVTGTVYGPDGAPHPYGRVLLYDTAGHRVAAGRSGSDGTYRLRGLRSGRYDVCAYDQTSGLAPECSGNVAWEGGQAPLPDGVQPVSVPARQTVNGPDITLSSGGTIAGTVRDSAGDLFRDQVSLYDASGAFVEHASADGKYGYQFEGVLPADGYLVCFSGNSAVRKGSRGALGRHSYAGRCYQEASWPH